MPFNLFISSLYIYILYFITSFLLDNDVLETSKRRAMLFYNILSQIFIVKRVHKVVVGMTNASGIGTDRKGVRKERKRVERKVGGEKCDFLVFLFCFQPP